MKKTLSDILCSVVMTVIAVVACAVLAVAIGLCAAVLACVTLPVTGIFVWGWSAWWCLLYAVPAIAIFLVIRNEPTNTDKP